MTTPPPARWKRLFAGAAITISLAAILFLWMLATFVIPAPTGPLPVGTTIIDLTDSSRAEDASTDGRRRQLVVQAWYPAKPSPASWAQVLRAPYRRWAETTRKSAFQRLLFTHSLQDAEVVTANGPLPVLIFNPSWDGRRTGSTFMTEELASHGFVVFAIDHPYNSAVVRLGDGRVVTPPPGSDLTTAHLGVEGTYAAIDKETEKQAADTLFVLNHLTAWNRAPRNRFYQRLNLGEVGAIGHSLGGSVSAEVAVRDARIAAVFDMSGPLFAQARKQGVRTPFFYLTEQLSLPDDATLAGMAPAAKEDARMDREDMAALHASLARYGGLYVTLPTADHSIFSDTPLLAPARFIHPAQRKSVDEMHDELRRFAVAFFNATLRGQPSPLLDSLRRGGTAAGPPWR